MRTRLLTTYKLLGIIILLSVFFACDPNGDPRDITYIHQLQVENTSAVALTLEAYDTYNEEDRVYFGEAVLKQTISIEANSKGPIVFVEDYSIGFNNGSYFSTVSVDSLVLKFENGKGYYATYLYKNGNEYREIDREHWIANKSPLFAVYSPDVRKEGDVYIYSITQEDYENAYELP